MYLLSDIITYVRRLIKTVSNNQITDALIIDYINRFWINDVDARIQLFDLKTKYQFQTSPGYDQYNIPLYGLQTEPGPQNISYYPVYQGFLGPAYINGIQIPFQTDRSQFWAIWPNYTQQNQVVVVANGGSDYRFQIPTAPQNSNPNNPPFQYLLRGHVDINGIISLANTPAYNKYSDPPVVNSVQAQSTIPAVPLSSVNSQIFITTTLEDGSSVVVQDSGQFLEGNTNFGLLMNPGTNPNGNIPLNGGYSTTMNVVNYFTGDIFVRFTKSDGTPLNIPAGKNINVQCFLYQTGLPRSLLFWNNTIIIRSPPDQQYMIELDAYLTPAGFLATNQSIPFGYMSEYIARGASRKILSDLGDIEQFNFYEPLFFEQEALVWKRSQRQFTSTRTQTIYSQGLNMGQQGSNTIGGYTS